MSNMPDWMGKERKMKLEQLAYILSTVKSFEVSLDDGRTCSNVISDLMIPDIDAQDTILLYQEQILLKTDKQGKVVITVSQDFDGYEVNGENFWMFLYD